MIEVFEYSIHPGVYPSNNGDAILQPISCVVKAQLNGTWELQIEHPLDEEGRWQYLHYGNILRVPSHNGKQLFRIRTYDQTDETVVATADPIFYDAGNDCFLDDIRPTAVNGQVALGMILTPNDRYRSESDITKVTTSYYVRKNAMEAINGSDENSFLNRWGGEIEYDNLTIRVMQRIGADNGVLVRTGKNLPRNGLKFTVDGSNTINRIVPLAYNGHGRTTTPAYVDAIIPVNAIRRTGVITFENIRLASDTGYGEGETIPDYITVCANQAALNTALQTAAENYFTETRCYENRVSMDVDIAVLQSLDEYKDFTALEQIGLGDTVYVFNKRMGIGWYPGLPQEYNPRPVRVTEIEWDCIMNRASRIKARTTDSRTTVSGGGGTTVGSGTSPFQVDKKGDVVMGDKLIFGNSAVTVPTWIQHIYGNANGSALLVRPGGPLVIGGGEYASNRYAQGDISSTQETAHFGADSTVYLESNANTIGSRKTWEFDTSGNITTPTDGLINGVDITKLCNYGAVQTLSPTVSLSSGTTWQNVKSFDLTPGLWVIEIAARFSTNASGYRALNVSSTSGGSAISYLTQDIRAAVPGTFTYMKLTATYRSATNSTLYINAQQNSGASLTFSMNYKITLLKGE